MTFAKLDLYYHMANHYRKIREAKAVVDCSCPKGYSKNSCGNSLRAPPCQPVQCVCRPIRSCSPESYPACIPRVNYSRCRSAPICSKYAWDDTRSRTPLPLTPRLKTSDPLEKRNDSKIKKPPVKKVSKLPQKTTMKGNLKEEFFQGREAQEHEYLHFLLNITEDILRSNTYVEEDMDKLFESHIEANKQRLDENRMRMHVQKLKKELNLPLPQVQCVCDSNLADCICLSKYSDNKDEDLECPCHSTNCSKSHYNPKNKDRLPVIEEKPSLTDGMPADDKDGSSDNEGESNQEMSELQLKPQKLKKECCETENCVGEECEVLYGHSKGIAASRTEDDDVTSKKLSSESLQKSLNAKVQELKSLASKESMTSDQNLKKSSEASVEADQDKDLSYSEKDRKSLHSENSQNPSKEVSGSYRQSEKSLEFEEKNTQLKDSLHKSELSQEKPQYEDFDNKSYESENLGPKSLPEQESAKVASETDTPENSPAEVPNIPKDEASSKPKFICACNVHQENFLTSQNNCDEDYVLVPGPVCVPRIMLESKTISVVVQDGSSKILVEKPTSNQTVPEPSSVKKEDPLAKNIQEAGSVKKSVFSIESIKDSGSAKKQSIQNSESLKEEVFSIRTHEDLGSIKEEDNLTKSSDETESVKKDKFSINSLEEFEDVKKESEDEKNKLRTSAENEVSYINDLSIVSIPDEQTVTAILKQFYPLGDESSVDMLEDPESGKPVKPALVPLNSNQDESMAASVPTVVSEVETISNVEHYDKSESDFDNGEKGLLLVESAEKAPPSAEQNNERESLTSKPETVSTGLQRHTDSLEIFSPPKRECQAPDCPKKRRESIPSSISRAQHVAPLYNWEKESLANYFHREEDGTTSKKDLQQQPERDVSNITAEGVIASKVPTQDIQPTEKRDLTDFAKRYLEQSGERDAADDARKYHFLLVDAATSMTSRISVATAEELVSDTSVKLSVEDHHDEIIHSDIIKEDYSALLDEQYETESKHEEEATLTSVTLSEQDLEPEAASISVESLQSRSVQNTGLHSDAITQLMSEAAVADQAMTFPERSRSESITPSMIQKPGVYEPKPEEIVRTVSPSEMESARSILSSGSLENVKTSLENLTKMSQKPHEGMKVRYSITHEVIDPRHLDLINRLDVPVEPLKNKDSFSVKSADVEKDPERDAHIASINEKMKAFRRVEDINENRRFQFTNLDNFEIRKISLTENDDVAKSEAQGGKGKGPSRAKKK